MVDHDGIITAKFFEASLALRANADQLRRAALGEPIEIAPAAAHGPVDDVEVSVDFDGKELGRGILRDLIIRLRVPSGQHLYGEPVPDGMVATSIDLDDHKGLVALDPVLPPTRPHTLAGTGETLHVFDGDVVIRMPISHNGRGLTQHDNGACSITVAGTVRFQSCDDELCHLPSEHRFELELPAHAGNDPDFARTDESKSMDLVHHFTTLAQRHSR